MTYSELVNNILGQISKEPEVIKEITFWKKNKDRLGYETAEAFSKVLGTATAKHLKPLAEQMQPEEIKQVYQHVSDLMIKYCEDATANITGRAGLKFIPSVKVDVQSDINDMLDNLVTRMYDTDSWEDVKFLANENSARSITRKTTTSHMKYTARSQQGAGIKVLISRTGGAECCDYCAGLTGTFTSLSDLPDNFWSVHRNCTCSFHYNVGKTNNIVTFSTDEKGRITKETN